MAISKRLRFEILRRDNFACHYCGAKAPDVELHVDHVVPSALGGTDTPENLVTACADCNSGKSATPADASVIAAVSAAAFSMRDALKQAAEEAQQRVKNDEKRIADFVEHWDNHAGPSAYMMASVTDATILRVLDSGLPWAEIDEAVQIATNARWIPGDDRFRYFMGVYTNKLRALHERAAEIHNERGGDA